MEIRECSQEYWDAFLDRSPQGTVFNKSFFLKSYDLPLKFLICYNGQEPLSGFGFAETADCISAMPYLVNSGIIFDTLSGVSNYRFNETVFEALDTWAKYLFERYQQIDFSNHWDIIDIRPFDWVNYHEREKGYYQILPRYTTLLDISNPTDTRGYARKRIRELDKGQKEGHRFSTKCIDDIDLLDHLHAATFSRNGILRSNEESAALRAICVNVLEAKAGVLLATYVNDQPAVASLFIYDKHRAYHLFVGTDDTFRESGVGTKNLHESCIFLNQQKGFKELDMVGANSPLRSSYKLSYGGRLVPYFRIKKIPPKTGA